MDLFGPKDFKAPLAERVRPQTLDKYVGQKQILNEDGALHRMIKSGKLSSMILWGPPGVGKTTLARIIAQNLDKPFRQLSAVQSGVKDVREVLQFAKSRPGTVLFIDEIHRFNKSQQDSLLNAVERGLVILIGATTENPSFEVNAALLSRSQVYRLEALSEAEIRELLEYAIQADKELSERKIELKEVAAIHRITGGDARKALNLLELFVNYSTEETVIVTDVGVKDIAQEKIALYDKGGEQHYDIISAFIKSVRGSDPNAAVYWLARMIDCGEDVKFIARRLIILASEDIGNANPNGLLLANACFQSVHTIGMPEARIVLSQATTYLACSPKSNAAYMAINKAMSEVKNNTDFPVPLHLRNAATNLMKDMGYGKAYKYSHDFEAEEGRQEFLPKELKGTAFYRPKDIGREKELRKFISDRWGDEYK